MPNHNNRQLREEEEEAPRRARAARPPTARGRRSHPPTRPAAFCSDGTLLALGAAPKKGDISRYRTQGHTEVARRAAAARLRPDPPAAAAKRRRCDACEEDPSAHSFFSIGVDKRGWEVLYCCPARARRKEPYSSSEHTFKRIEAAMERARPAGTGKFVMAVDLHGLGVRDLDPRTGTICTSAFLAHLPGQIGQCCILDAPLLFKFSWRLIAALLDAETAEKVQMLRGESMHTTLKSTATQRGGLREVPKMSAAGLDHLPPSYAELVQPMDNRPPTVPATPPTAADGAAAADHADKEEMMVKIEDPQQQPLTTAALLAMYDDTEEFV